jgi:hypothetical protein
MKLHFLANDCLCQVFLGRPITRLVWRSIFVHLSATARLCRLLAHLFGERSKKMEPSPNRQELSKTFN